MALALRENSYKTPPIRIRYSKFYMPR